MKKRRKIDWNHVSWFLAQMMFCIICIPYTIESVRALRVSEEALFETHPLKWMCFCVTIIWWMIVTPSGPIEYIRAWKETR